MTRSDQAKIAATDAWPDQGTDTETLPDPVSDSETNTWPAIKTDPTPLLETPWTD